MIDPFYLVVGNGDVVLSNTEKAANSNDYIYDLAGVIQQQFIDVAYFLVGIIVHVDTDNL